MKKLWIVPVLILLLWACDLFVPGSSGSTAGGSASVVAAAQGERPAAPLLSPTEIHSVHAPLGIPVGAPATNDLIFRHTYTASTNDQTKFADWVAYVVTRTWMEEKYDPERDYATDPFLDEDETLEERSGTGDYDDAHARHGYDRGHLIPLGSFHGSPFFQEVNYLSVLAPQVDRLNRGVWRSLENRVRRLVTAHGDTYILAGPYYDKDAPRMPELPGADESHTVPTGYWMIVYRGDVDSPEVSAFLVPQQLPVYDGPEDFITSVDEVETRTGLDFLALLDDATETLVESTTGLEWFESW